MKEKTDGERKESGRGKKEGREEKGQVEVKFKEMLKMENQGNAQKAVSSNRLQQLPQYDLGIKVNVNTLSESSV